MKTFLKLVLFSILFSAQALTAQTMVSGIISENTTWTKANSPYNVTASVNVVSSTLTIEPGVTIKFAADTKLKVDNGVIKAIGTANDSIHFVSDQDNSISQGYWEGILLRSASKEVVDSNFDYVDGSIFQYVSIKNAATGLYLYYSGIYIANTKLEYNSNAIELRSTDGVAIKESTFTNNQNGVISLDVSSSDAMGDIINTLISSNIFTSNQVAISLNHNQKLSQNFQIEKNHFKSNTSNDINLKYFRCESLSINQNIFESLYSNNSINIYQLRHNYSDTSVRLNIYNNLFKGGLFSFYSRYDYDNINFEFRNNIIVNTEAEDPDQISDYSFFRMNEYGMNDSRSIKRKIFNNNTFVSKGTIINLFDSRGDGYFPRGLEFKNNTLLGQKTADAFFVDGKEHQINANNFLFTPSEHKIISTRIALDFDATGNYWEVEEANIPNYIRDKNDDIDLGTISYSPVLTQINTDAPISPVRGIVKIQDGANTKLIWSANNESDLAGYKIYHGNSTGYSYGSSVDVGNVTEYILEGVDASEEIAITAYDSSLASLGSENVLLDQTNGYESWYTKATDYPTVNLSASSTSIEEGDSDITITVSLDGYTPLDVVINLTLSGAESSQYSSTSVITIPSGSLESSIELSAVDDSEIETIQILNYTISSATGAIIGENKSIDIDIISDDLPSVSFTNEKAQIAEHESTVLTAILEKAHAKDTQISFTVSGTALYQTDYTVSTNLINDFSLVAGGNGQGSALNQLSNPRGSAIDSENNIYIADNSNGRIMKYAQNSSEGTVFASGLNNPQNLMIDSSGMVYVLQYDGTITEHNPDGTVSHTFEAPVSGSQFYDFDYIEIDGEKVFYTAGYSDSSWKYMYKISKSGLERINLNSFEQSGNGYFSWSTWNYYYYTGVKVLDQNNILLIAYNRSFLLLDIADYKYVESRNSILDNGSSITKSKYGDFYLATSGGNNLDSRLISKITIELQSKSVQLRTILTKEGLYKSNGIAAPIYDENGVLSLPEYYDALGVSGISEDSSGNIYLTMEGRNSTGYSHRVVKYKLGPTIEIPAGQLSSSLTISGIEDNKNNEELEETILLTPTVKNTVLSDENLSVQTTIINNFISPTINLSSSATSIEEGGASINIKATIDYLTLEDVVVNLTLSGAESSQYSSTSVITIPSGSLESSIELSAVDDSEIELNQTLNYTISSATGALIGESKSIDIDIISDDLPSVSFTNEKAQIAEHESTVLTAILEKAHAKDTQISFTVSGTALYQTDYTVSTNLINDFSLVAGGNGQGSALNQLSNPRGSAIDSENNIYIADNSNGRIMKYAQNSSEGTVFASGLNNPQNLMIDSSGMVYVLQYDGTITEHNPDGTVSHTFEAPVSGSQFYDFDYIEIEGEKVFYTAGYSDSSWKYMYKISKSRLERINLDVFVETGWGDNRYKGIKVLDENKIILINRNYVFFLDFNDSTFSQQYKYDILYSDSSIIKSKYGDFYLATDNGNTKSSVVLSKLTVDPHTKSIQYRTLLTKEDLKNSSGIAAPVYDVDGSMSIIDYYDALGVSGISEDASGNIYLTMEGRNSTGYSHRVVKYKLGPTIEIPAGQLSSSLTISGIEDKLNDEQTESIVFTPNAKNSIVSENTSSIQTELLNNSINLVELDSPFIGLENGAVSWGDFDRDGDQDVAVMGLSATLGAVTAIYQNNDGVFKNRNEAFTKVYDGDLEWVDINKDGWIDLVVSGIGVDSISTKVYLNNQGQYFSEASYQLPNLFSSVMDWGDLDNDGDIDLAISGINEDDNYVFTVYFKSDTEDTFYEINKDNNGLNYWNVQGFIKGDLLIADVDGDTDNDIIYSGKNKEGNPVGGIITNSYVRKQSYNQFRSYKDASIEIIPTKYNYIDYTLENPEIELRTRQNILVQGKNESDENRLYLSFNNNRTYYSNSSYWDYQGLEYSSSSSDLIFPLLTNGDISSADFDNNGEYDLIFSGEDITGTPRTYLYLQENGVFSLSNHEIRGLRNSTVDFIDYDLDGDLDVFLSGLDSSGAKTLLYRNDLTNKLNNKPDIITGLDIVDKGNGKILLKWDHPKDDYSKELGYVVRIGTTPGGSELSNTLSNLETGQRLITKKATVLNNFYETQLEPGNYFWSVQAVDSGLKSSVFSEEASFQLTYQWKSLNLGGVLDQSIAGVENPIIELFDSNNDGLFDLLYGSKDGDLKLYKLDNNKFASQGITSSDNCWGCDNLNKPISVAVGDVNGDKKTDFVVNYGNGDTKYTKLFWSRESNDYFDSTTVDTGLFKHKTKIVDMNNDGVAEIVQLGVTSESSSGRMSMIIYEITFSEFNTPTIVKHDLSDQFDNLRDVTFDSGDIDNDQDYDIIVSGFNPANGIESTVYENISVKGESFQFKKSNDNLVPISNGSSDLIDYDNDGDLDGFFAGTGIQGDVFTVYKNLLIENGSRQFAAFDAGLPPLRNGVFDLGDLNSDGYPDLIFSGTIEGIGETSGIKELDPNTFKYVDSTFNIENMINAQVEFGDIDGDGDLDFIIAGEYGDGDGDGVFDIPEGETSQRFFKAYLNRMTESAAVLSSKGSFTVSKQLTNKDVDFVVNSKPTVPVIKGYKVIEVKQNNTVDIEIEWEASEDDYTPQSGITYNIKLGTSNGGEEIISSNSLDDGSRKISTKGNVELNTKWKLNLESGKYYFAVQAVDASFYGSEFSETFEFEINSKIAPMGDSNNDGNVNVLDIVNTVDYILGKNPTTFLDYATDVNNDSNINVLDIVGIVSIILNNTDSGKSSSSQSYISTKANSKAIVYWEKDELIMENEEAVGGFEFKFNNKITYSVGHEFIALNGIEYSKEEENYLMLFSTGERFISPGKHVLISKGDPSISFKPELLIVSKDGTPIDVDYREVPPSLTNKVEDKSMIQVLSFAPNPTKGPLDLYYYLPQKIEKLYYSVYNNYGALVIDSRKLNNEKGFKQETIQLSGQNKGMYFVVIYAEEKNKIIYSKTLKVIVE